jgi:phenylpyruvate tautomerase PptA (4-oxalocrotonate tautomerase family)
MPFLEILAPVVPGPTRAAIARAATDAVCTALAVGAETVTLYFLDIEGQAYAHAGAMGGPQRIFIKLHAYRRDVAARRRAAAGLTSPLAALYGVPEEAIALYFFDRALDEVAHGGRLSCDAEPG